MNCNGLFIQHAYMAKVGLASSKPFKWKVESSSIML